VESESLQVDVQFWLGTVSGSNRRHRRWWQTSVETMTLGNKVVKVSFTAMPEKGVAVEGIQGMTVIEKRPDPYRVEHTWKVAGQIAGSDTVRSPGMARLLS
jgi:hypothetical protein